MADLFTDFVPRWARDQSQDFSDTESTPNTGVEPPMEKEMSADQLPSAPEYGTISTVTYGELPGSLTVTTAPLMPIDMLHPSSIATVAEEAHVGLGTSLMNAIASGVPWKTVAMKLLVLAAEEFIAWAKEQSPPPPVNP